MTAEAMLNYTVEAYNLSHASENKIHDDDVAQKLGFTGGLVPGVEVFAYMTHVPVTVWGTAFFERGQISCRFAKPVYDGRVATVVGEPEGGARLQLRVESGGMLCATGEARLPEADSPPPRAADYAAPEPPAIRPPADEKSLAVGTELAVPPRRLTREIADTYLSDARETEPLYREHNIAHPGFLLRMCNLALVENVVLAPWIHTGSRVQFFSPAHVGEMLAARARVAANYDRKGHRFVDLDCVILGDEQRPIAYVLHTAIYRLRHLAG